MLYLSLHTSAMIEGSNDKHLGGLTMPNLPILLDPKCGHPPILHPEHD